MVPFLAFLMIITFAVGDHARKECAKVHTPAECSAQFDPPQSNPDNGGG